METLISYSLTRIFESKYINMPDTMQIRAPVIPKDPISLQMIRDPNTEMANVGLDGIPEIMVTIRKWLRFILELTLMGQIASVIKISMNVTSS